ncbi:NifB/NifX family molybdenum-iron cluster-binding protein [Vibrio sonorensis]|uniref:NifB/NifX family molybdenum-iron cluster-binding protein n=1 Tax=Vibrio sonorensis TaxID=1004316 RepID=UPI0008D91BE4|nr:NifB/NifX family molybdenum-iron cluster-binding protein [Vibrio sonorensis]
MMYAIPCTNGCVSNHFSRADEITVLDEEGKVLAGLPFVENGKNTQWNWILEQYDIDAVVVRSIGRKMLDNLFSRKIKVLSVEGKVAIEHLDVTLLKEVENLAYAKQSRRPNRCDL